MNFFCFVMGRGPSGVGFARRLPLDEHGQVLLMVGGLLAQRPETTPILPRRELLGKRALGQKMLIPEIGS
ncbi:MAG TPA: hypothetical protein PK777_05720 [Thermoguttaceae bacterium]|nr:hypothetical protein [Thermoguttaceae bacterium]